MISSVTGVFNNTSFNLTYNEDTGYYEATLTAPDLPSALLPDKAHPIVFTVTADDADTLTFTEYVIVVPEFIYDRTQEDVDLVKELNAKYQNDTITNDEKAVWNGELKGALNLSDLQRNERNLYCISELLNLSLDTNFVPSTHSYTIPEIPKESYYTNLLGNVQEAYDTDRLYTDTPNVPEGQLNTYEKWNAIEHILHDVYYVASSETDGTNYCGEIYTGQMVGLI